MNVWYFVRINATEYSHVVSLLSLSSKMMPLPSARKFWTSASSWDENFMSTSPFRPPDFSSDLFPKIKLKRSLKPNLSLTTSKR